MTPEEKAKAEALEAWDTLDKGLNFIKEMLEQPNELILENAPALLADMKAACKLIRAHSITIRAALEAKGVDEFAKAHEEGQLKMRNDFTGEMEIIPAPVGEPIEGLREALTIEDLDTPEWEDAQRPFELKYGKTIFDTFHEAARRYAAGQKTVDAMALRTELVDALIKEIRHEKYTTPDGWATWGAMFIFDHLIAQGILKTNGGE